MFAIIGGGIATGGLCPLPDNS